MITCRGWWTLWRKSNPTMTAHSGSFSRLLYRWVSLTPPTTHFTSSPPPPPPPTLRVSLVGAQPALFLYFTQVVRSTFVLETCTRQISCSARSHGAPAAWWPKHLWPYVRLKINVLTETYWERAKLYSINFEVHVYTFLYLVQNIENTHYKLWTKKFDPQMQKLHLYINTWNDACMRMHYACVCTHASCLRSLPFSLSRSLSYLKVGENGCSVLDYNNRRGRQRVTNVDVNFLTRRYCNDL